MTAQEREVPLMPRNGNACQSEDSVTTEDLHSFIASNEVSASPNRCRLRWLRMLNYLTLIAMFSFVTLVSVLIVKFLVVNFEAIWANGFVAALFLGGLVFVAKTFAVWFSINIIGRFFFTTIKLSKESKEATPVLEWFKVWLPKMMKERGSSFRSVQPLFRKKDGTTFFSFFRDIRSTNKFEMISWVTPGTHFFRFYSTRLGGSIDIAMHYWTGEAKKEGWDQALTVMESMILTCFDPYSQAMPYFMDMLAEAQERFAERDLDCIRFHEWHGWKEMWESTVPDECIAPNFKTLAFYPSDVLEVVEKECDQFLREPNEHLLRAGLPLKLGFLFHGPPGTGKTNLVRYLAAKYRLTINVVDCNSGNMDNNQLLRSVVSASGIVLFEDIDNLDAACGRVRDSGISLVGNKAEMNKRVTLDGLLNALDGVHRGTQKRIMIATTNYPEKLIPSIRRRGRFGYSVKIDYPEDQELESMFKYYLPQLPRDEVLTGIHAVERSLGLRLSTAAAVDIIAKISLQRSNDPMSVLGSNVVKQVEGALRELETSNRKQLHGTHELLSLLGLEKYAKCLYEEGLFDMRYVKLLNDGELSNIGIDSLGDRKKLLDSFQYMEDTPPLSGDRLDKARANLRAMRDQDPKVVLFDGIAKLLREVFEGEEASEFEAKFKEEGMAMCTMEELKKLNDGDLEKLGLKRLGDRQRLLLCIEKLTKE